ncbi:hypothetical protein D1007_40432 [Hordeum vulgare]|nr:hypothetical protein D1007_40432 [Hordeum vulgare]
MACGLARAVASSSREISCGPTLPGQGAGQDWTLVCSRRACPLARRQEDLHPRLSNDFARHPTSPAEAFKRRFGSRCYRYLGSRHKAFECRDPQFCYTCKRPGHLERECIRRRPKVSAPVPHPPTHVPPSAAGLPPPTSLLGASRLGSPSYVDVVSSSAPSSVPVAAMPTGTIPGAAHRRPATSTCSVVSTPEMEDESYRLRTTALLLTAAGPCPGISVDMVAEAVEHDQGFSRRDICVAPCFPEDFLLVLSECHQHDLIFERRQLVMAGSWDNVQEVLGKKCRLDLIERQSTTKANVSALFAWLCAWDPNLIPRASDFNILNRPDVARPWRSLPEGTPSEQGKEGPHFPVLIHLDVVKDYTPVQEEDMEWPRIYEHKDWKMGSKDGERRGRAVVSDGHAPDSRRKDDDGDDGFNGGSRRRGKRSGAQDGFSQGVRDRANCRDAAARAPATRRYRCHDRSAGSKARVAGLDMAVPPTAAIGRAATLVQQVKSTTSGFVSPAMQAVQGAGSKDRPMVQDSDDSISDALSVTNA